MPSVVDMVKYRKQLQEFGYYAQAIKPVMIDPNIPREGKRKTLNDLVESLTPKTLETPVIADMIIEIINMKRDVCKEYPNTEAQVQGILSWLPKMVFHKARLVEAVTKNRKLYGLNI